MDDLDRVLGPVSDFTDEDDMAKFAEDILANLEAHPAPAGRKEKGPRVISYDEFGHPLTVNGQPDRRWAESNDRVKKTAQKGPAKEPGVARADGITSTMAHVSRVLEVKFYGEPQHTICGFQVKHAYVVEVDPEWAENHASLIIDMEQHLGLCGAGEIRTRRPDLLPLPVLAKAGSKNKKVANEGAFDDDAPAPEEGGESELQRLAREARERAADPVHTPGEVKVKIAADPDKVAARDAAKAAKAAARASKPVEASVS